MIYDANPYFKPLRKTSLQISLQIKLKTEPKKPKKKLYLSYQMSVAVFAMLAKFKNQGTSMQ